MIGYNKSVGIGAGSIARSIGRSARRLPGIEKEFAMLLLPPQIPPIAGGLCVLHGQNARSWEHTENKGPEKRFLDGEADNILK